MDVRARELPTKYRTKAIKIDRKYCRTAADDIGPLQQRLQSFGDLQCLVVGQYGEVSQHLHDLLGRFATCQADQIARSTGRPVSDQQRGQLLHQLRRELSVTAVRAQASCLLSRLGHIGSGAREAAQRRTRAKQTVELARKDALAHWEAEVRGGRLRPVGRLRL